MTATSTPTTTTATPSAIIPIPTEPILTKEYDKTLESRKEEESELEFYRGFGELVIKRTEHRGAATKVMGIAAGAVSFGVGYVIVGKDKTSRKSKAEGSIVITNKAIYVWLVMTIPLIELLVLRKKKAEYPSL